MRNRQAQNPKRRIADPGTWTPEALEALLQTASYVGSANHKRRPADYGFHPPVNPRPHKSLCDDHGYRLDQSNAQHQREYVLQAWKQR